MEEFSESIEVANSRIVTIVWQPLKIDEAVKVGDGFFVVLQHANNTISRGLLSKHRDHGEHRDIKHFSVIFVPSVLKSLHIQRPLPHAPRGKGRLSRRPIAQTTPKMKPPM